MDFTVERLPWKFIQKYGDYESYVLVCEDDYRNIFNVNANGNFQKRNKRKVMIKCEGLVKIVPKNGKGRVYRKCKMNGKAGSAMMGSRTKELLNSRVVCIFPSSWLSFMWHHPEFSIRYSFISGVVFGLTSIILSVLSLIVSI